MFFPEGKTQISLKGTPGQLDFAERLIVQQLEELEAMDKKVRSSAESRPPRTRVGGKGGEQQQLLFLTAENGAATPPSARRKQKVERLTQVTGEKSLGVFVSAISDPGRFYVQKVPAQAIAVVLEADYLTYIPM